MIIKAGNNNIQIQVLNHNDLTSDIIKKWSELEQRSVEGNPYLSPYFVIPAIKYLTPRAELIFVFISRVSHGTQNLNGVGVFEYVPGSRTFPLPHLRSYCTPHSYLSGLLVDEEFIEQTLSAFFTFFNEFGRYSCGVEFKNRTEDSLLAKHIETTASIFKMPWLQYRRTQRPILIPRNLDSILSKSSLSAKLKKNMRRCERLLAERGTIHWQIVNGKNINKSTIDHFLHLENMGWKGLGGTSLQSSHRSESFFREMIGGFISAGRVFFTELKINDQVIASTSNLISSKSGYAFKIGWDVQFAQMSPGLLNEYEFIKNAAHLLPHLEYIDSGANEGSFIEKLWHDSYALVSGIYATKVVAKPVIAGIACIRRLRNVFISP